MGICGFVRRTLLTGPLVNQAEAEVLDDAADDDKGGARDQAHQGARVLEACALESLLAGANRARDVVRACPPSAPPPTGSVRARERVASGRWKWTTHCIRGR